MQNKIKYFGILKSLVHVYGKLEQETVLFEFEFFQLSSLPDGSAITQTQVVKFLGSHVPVEISGGE